MEANKIFNNNSNVYLQGPKFQSNVVLFEKPKLICLNGAVKQMHGISFIFEEKADYNGKKKYNTVRIPLIGELLEPGAVLESYNSLLLPEEKIDELTTKKVFTRSDMVQIVYNSLKTQMDDETVFADYLLEKNVLTKKEVEQMK